MKTSILFLFILFLFSLNIYSQTKQSLVFNNVDEEIEITIYPNPATDVIYFKCNQKIESIILYNKQGKEVLKSLTNENKIKLTNLDDGFYLFCAFVNGKKVKKGIIKKT